MGVQEVAPWHRRGERSMERGRQTGREKLKITPIGRRRLRRNGSWEEGRLLGIGGWCRGCASLRVGP